MPLHDPLTSLRPTSLEAGDGRRDLHPASEQIEQRWECYRKEDAEESGGDEEESPRLIAMYLCYRFHVDVGEEIIAAIASSSRTSQSPSPACHSLLSFLIVPILAAAIPVRQDFDRSSRAFFPATSR